MGFGSNMFTDVGNVVMTNLLAFLCSIVTNIGGDR